MTETVVLAVGAAADTGESVALYDALEAFTLGCADDVHEFDAFCDDVSKRDDVAELEFSREIGREFDQFLLGSGSCLFEVALWNIFSISTKDGNHSDFLSN